MISAGGTVLRYGRFYGPGTDDENDLPPAPRLHIDAVARRTMPFLAGPRGIFTITTTIPPHDLPQQLNWSKAYADLVSTRLATLPRPKRNSHAFETAARASATAVERGVVGRPTRAESWRPSSNSAPSAASASQLATAFAIASGRQIPQAPSHIRGLANSCKGSSCLSAAKSRRRSPKAYRRGRRQAHTFCRHDLSRQAR